MKVLKYPLIPITLSLAAGIILAQALKPSIGFTVIILFIAIVFFCTSYFFAKKSILQKPWFALCSLFLGFSIGYAAFAIHYPPNHSGHYSASLDTSHDVVIEGYISERIKPNDFNEKYIFKITAANHRPATGKILLNVPKDSLGSPFYPGDILVIYDSPGPFAEAKNPYQFDYSVYMEHLGIFHQVKLKSNYIRAGSRKNFDYYTGHFREKLIRSFDSHEFSQQVMNVIKALLLGQRQDMDKDLNDSYINAGVIHILAISGLHIAILFYFFNMLLRPLTRFNSKGRLLQLFIALAFLWSFAVIAGLSASVVRAVVMFSFVSLGQFLDREAKTFNSIAISMLALLLAKPAFLFDTGFQLSYAAVFAIVWVQPLFNKIKRSRYKAVNYITGIVTISLIAQLGVLPLSLYYFNQFPLLFPVANIVVIPLATLILITGIVVLAFNFIWLDAALIAGKLLGLLIEIMNGFIEWIASFKEFVLKDIPFTALLAVLAYVMIILAVRWLYKKEYRRAVTLLCSVLVFQFAYTLTKLATGGKNEFVVFHNFNHTLIAEKQDNTITFYTEDSIAANNFNVKSYSRGNFADSISFKHPGNLLWHNSRRILIVDSAGVYNATIRPDVLILTQSPKVNLERVLDSIQPEIIIADATNFKSYVSRWQATCLKRKIPFHATAEKGSYIIR